MTQALLFTVIYIVILVVAEFVWSFYITFIVLKLFRVKDPIFTKKFFVFVSIAAVISLVINNTFKFLITNISSVQNLWASFGQWEKLGLILVPTFIMMYAYFYLASVSFKLKSKQVIILVLILGLANSPWRILL